MIKSYTEYIFNASLNDPDFYEKQKKLHFYLFHSLNMPENLAEHLSMFLLMNEMVPQILDQIDDRFIKDICDNNAHKYALDNRLKNDIEFWYYTQPKFDITARYHYHSSYNSTNQGSETKEEESSYNNFNNFGLFSCVDRFDTHERDNLSAYEYDSDSSLTQLLKSDADHALLPCPITHSQVPLLWSYGCFWDEEDAQGFKV